jgi:hypothetical protein
MAGRRLVSVQAQSIRYCRGAVPGDCCPESGNVGVGWGQEKSSIARAASSRTSSRTQP